MATPMEFDQAIADEICDKIASGKSLRTICGGERDDFIPGQTTVYRWLRENADFAKQYALARELQAETLVDEIIEIADSPNTTVDKDGAPVVRDPARDRLRIDARKWFASKVVPKKYGDKVSHEHTGADGGALAVTYVAPPVAVPSSEEDYET